MKGIIAFFIGVVISLIAVLLVRVGYFKPVTTEISESGPYQVVVKHHVGAYNKIVPVIEEVEKWARENGEPCTVSLGEYIDDPKTAEEDRLNSNGGCVVEKDWSKGLPEGFVVREIPRARYLIATFEGAPSIGPLKVYPAAMAEIEAKGLTLSGPVIEMYTVLPKERVSTRYLFPVR